MRSGRRRGVDQEYLQGLWTVDTARAMCGGGRCKKRYFEDNAEIFDSAKGFLVSHCGQMLALLFISLRLRLVISEPSSQASSPSSWGTGEHCV